MTGWVRDRNARAATVRASTAARAGRTAQPATSQPRLQSSHFRLVCPAGCAALVARGAHKAARLLRIHADLCPQPGPAVRPVPDGPAIYPLIYAERVTS